MAEILEQGLEQATEFGAPAVIIPQGFSLDRHSEENKAKIKDEIIERVSNWETYMGPSFEENLEAANSYRMIPRSAGKKPRGMFNSKSGETNRAVKTLSSFWFRATMAGDPFFRGKKTGLNFNGQEITESELHAVEDLMLQQFTELEFKRKWMKFLKSVALFGTAFAERVWTRVPAGNSDTYFEGTDFILRSLLQVAFDPYVFDMDYSDFIATIDFPTKYQLRTWANINDDLWDRAAIEKILSDRENDLSLSKSFKTSVWARISERKQRAGYEQTDKNVFELINYHGRLGSNNPIFEDIWQNEGRTDDIRFTDWTLGILNSDQIVRAHSTPWGSWKYQFGVSHKEEFELEALGYGVGKIGKKTQRELDILQSRAQDAITKAVYQMQVVSKLAGLGTNQLTYIPNGLIELDDVNAMRPLEVDYNAIVQSLSMMGILKEDFRSTTGAQTNLQGISVKGVSATASALAQTEAVRNEGVQSEIIAETLRKHIKVCHMNNTVLLDKDIWVELSGTDKPQMIRMNKENIPFNMGFSVKLTTDKDFGERIRVLLELVQFWSSVRNDLPQGLNVIEPITEEIFRLSDISPRLLRKPMPVGDQMSLAIQKASRGSGGAADLLSNEVLGEAAGAGQGGASFQQTPVGPVPTSPDGSQGIVA